MELKKYKLGELIDVTRGQSLSGEYYATEGKYIRLTCGNFDYNNNCFKENTSKDNLFFTGTIKPEFIMGKGDIITPLTEQAIGLLGSTAIIPESDKYIQSQDVAKIICKEDKLDHGFAYYLISSKLVKEQLSVAAQQTKIRHTSPDKIKDCTVWIPDMENQRRIAHVLSTLDRKISLNRSINAELERMAKEIYDYWFVQFEFPDANGRPYKSSGGAMVYNPVLKREVPEGWEVLQYQDILDKYKSTKKLDTKEYLDEGDIPIIDQGPNYIVGYTNDAEAKLDRLPATLFGDHSLCVKYINSPFARGADGTQILYSNNSNIKAHYLYLSVKSLSIPNPGYSRHFKYLKEMYILQPDSKTSDNFEKIVSPIFDMWTKNCLQTVELSKNRDKLLPLLMTGQVEV